VYIPTQTVASKSNSPVTINGGLIAGKLEISTGQEIVAISGASGGSSYFVPKKAVIVE
jgi:hypothetical protein